MSWHIWQECNLSEPSRPSVLWPCSPCSHALAWGKGAPKCLILSPSTCAFHATPTRSQGVLLSHWLPFLYLLPAFPNCPSHSSPGKQQAQFLPLHFRYLGIRLLGSVHFGVLPYPSSSFLCAPSNVLSHSACWSFSNTQPLWPLLLSWALCTLSYPILVPPHSENQSQIVRWSNKN